MKKCFVVSLVFFASCKNDESDFLVKQMKERAGKERVVFESYQEISKTKTTEGLTKLVYAVQLKDKDSVYTKNDSIFYAATGDGIYLESK